MIRRTMPTIKHGQCNCCGEYREIHQCWAFGNLETWACDDCTEEPSDFWDRKAEERAQ